MKEFVDYEIISIEEISDESCELSYVNEYEDCYYEEDYDAIEEMEATLSVASLFEELGFV